MASTRSFIIKLLKVFLPASLLSTLLGAALAAGGKSIEKTSGKTSNSFHCSSRFVIEPFRLWSVRRLWKARVRWRVVRGIVSFSIKLSERTFKVSYWKLIKSPTRWHEKIISLNALHFTMITVRQWGIRSTCHNKRRRIWLEANKKCFSSHAAMANCFRRKFLWQCVGDEGSWVKARHEFQVHVLPAMHKW